MKIIPFVALIGLAGCNTLPASGMGTVTDITDRTVKIRGGYDFSGAKPTPQMVAQAKEICPSAEYVSAAPDPDSTYHFFYLFRCY